MNIHFKRLLCILLVISLMFTMSGCGVVVEIVFSLGQVLLSVGGNLIIVGIAWLAETITSPFIETTGKCACGFSTALFKGWNKLIDPSERLISWSDIDKEQISFHDDHLETLKDIESVEYESDRYLSNGIPKTGKNEIIIHYDANGGYAAPKDQIMKIKGNQKIAKEVPVRPGYHFMGWAPVFADDETREKTEAMGSNSDYHPIDENQPLYFPGKKADAKTGQKFSQDTTLYAVWADSNSLSTAEWFDHTYKIKQVGTGLWKKTPYVTIICSCGTKITENYLTDTQFDDIWEHSVNKEKGDKEKDRLHKLYNAQHIGPIALYLNTNYYTDKLTAKEVLDCASGISQRIESLAENTQKFAEEAQHALPGEDLAKEYFEQINIPMNKLEEQTKKTGNIAKKASFTISILQTASAFSTMMNEDIGLLEQTKGMLNTVECISSFASCGSFVSPVVDVLKEALDLVDKVDKNQTRKDASLAELYPADIDNYSPYLVHLFGNELSNLSNLTTTNETGCHCKMNPQNCNFASNGTSQPLENAPSVFEVIYKMSTTILTPQDEFEKEIVAYYLAEKSEHELFDACNLTLEGYLSLIQG